MEHLGNTRGDLARQPAILSGSATIGDQEEGGGLLGASGDCYLMLHGEVPDEVRAICDELCRREAKPSIWA